MTFHGGTSNTSPYDSVKKIRATNTKLATRILAMRTTTETLKNKWPERPSRGQDSGNKPSETNPRQFFWLGTSMISPSAMPLRCWPYGLLP